MNDRERMSPVKRCRSMVALHVVIVREAVAALAVVDRLRPGISHQEVQPMGKAFLRLQLEAVVVGVITVANTVNGLSVPVFVERPARIVVSRPRIRLIAIQIQKEVASDIADVSRFNRHARDDLMLDSKIPRIRQRNTVRAQWVEEEVDRYTWRQRVAPGLKRRYRSSRRTAGKKRGNGGAVRIRWIQILDELNRRIDFWICAHTAPTPAALKLRP